jgi:hypothetical protein
MKKLVALVEKPTSVRIATFAFVVMVMVSVLVVERTIVVWVVCVRRI